MSKGKIQFCDAERFGQIPNWELEDGRTTYSGMANGLTCLPQTGSLCGLYALASVLRVVCGIHDIVAHEGDQGAGDQENILLYRAIREGSSFIGEMSNGLNMATLFNSFTGQYKVPFKASFEEMTPARVAQTISSNGLVLIPYIAGTGGIPINDCRDPRNIHWCVAFGFESTADFTKPPVRVFTAHWGSLHIYTWAALSHSNQSISNGTVSDMYKNDENSLQIFKHTIKKLGTSFLEYHNLPQDVSDEQIQKKLAEILGTGHAVDLSRKCLYID